MGVCVCVCECVCVRIFVGNARVVFKKFVQVPFKYVDDLAQEGG